MEVSTATFARLKPSNTAAKLAFDAMYEAHPPPLDRGLVYVHPEQQYEKEILLFRLQEQRPREHTSESETQTDPDTDTENALKHCGMIWAGWFTFRLYPGPFDPTIGWIVGKGRREVNIDYVLTPGRGSSNVRGHHARFNFHQKTGHLFISKTSGAPHAEVTVNGKGVNSGEQHSLNQNPMSIRIGNLEFEFEYTEYAHTDGFYLSRQNYMREKLNGVQFPNVNLTPTPGSTFRCFGEWTLSRSLGKGAYGRVSSATNSKGEVVAIKVIERSERTVHQVSHEVRILRELQTLSEVHEDDRKRIVRLKDAIYQNGAEAYAPTAFEEVALILEPVVSATFAQITDPVVHNTLDNNMPDIASLFHDALLGVNFLHSHNWVHRDLKPSNIGIVDTGFPRAVLLDLEGAIKLQPASSLPATPGRGGTVNYLAPERELLDHDCLIDVWSMGVIGFELVHGHHPWKLALHPWRAGAQFEALRPNFHKKYRKAVYEMKRHNNSDLNDLLLRMLRHPWAEDNGGTRIAIRDALNHACWQHVERDEPPTKRRRPSL